MATRIGNYRIGKTLGVGSFGKVKLAEHEHTVRFHPPLLPCSHSLFLFLLLVIADRHAPGLVLATHILVAVCVHILFAGSFVGYACRVLAYMYASSLCTLEACSNLFLFLFFLF